MRSFIRSFGSLPALVVLTVVLLAGARLMYLSVQHHAAAARVTAATQAGNYAKKIVPRLENLAALADQQAKSAGKIISAGGDFASLASEPPVAHTFFMNADGQAFGMRPSESEIAGGIASEWKSAEAGRVLPQRALLGPMRLGSEWIIAVRAPVLRAGATPTPRGKGWSVAYAELGELLADAHLARLTDAGYDFELSQIEPRTASPRIFLSSSTEPLTDAVAARIELPAASAIPGSYLQLLLRPRGGWFPSSLLASEIALLAFLCWLLTFGAYDLGHELQRAKAAVTIARRRLHTVNQQLAAEMQQRVNLQETFDHARFHDTFTGLPNRRYFMDQLDRALRELRTKRRQRLAVIIVDISRVRLINHLLGHTAGDDLMVQVARRFEESTSPLDGTLARWGGDQFALLLFDVTAPTALEMANALQEQLHSPFLLRRHQLGVTATLGVTSVESGQARAEDIMREADIALAVAKRQESSKAILFTPNMGGQAEDLVSLEADLHLALQKQQLRLLFQPVVDLATFKMVGAEALLRWRHPVEGLLTPDRFLRHAEEAGLMVPITRWVIRQVIDVAADWRRHLPAEQKFYISVNLSPAALRDPGLADYVASRLREKMLPPALLKFELTEMALVGNVGVARESLERLHSMGIQLILDDFGTGYSSLSNLQLFPFSSVKIDCPFVDRRGVFQANMSMVAAMIQLAGSLDLTSMAEIVEGEAAASALKAMGCRYGQGYYFSRPIEADAALQKLRTQVSFEATAAPVEAVDVGPVEKDGSQTLILRRLEDPTGRERATAESVIVRPLAEGGSREVIFADAKDSPRREPAAPDSASTVLMPIETLGLPLDDHDEDEEED